MGILVVGIQTAHLVDNVLIVLAPIELNRSRPVVDDPSAAAFRTELEDWARMTDRLLIWDYVIQFANLVSPFPNLRVLQPNLRYFVDQHAIAHFQQGNREVGGEWAELRTWMIAQLLWNPNEDTDELIDEFLTGYYGAAAPHLRAYIDSQHDALEASGAGLGIFGNPISASKTYLKPGDKLEATIEGIGTPDNLAPLQAAFVKHDGFQCGYCTPGQICSATGMLNEAKQGWPSHASERLEGDVELTDDEIRERMSGNLCRCSAYPNIVDAIREVAEERA